jgi:hypothetical protein
VAASAEAIAAAPIWQNDAGVSTARQAAAVTRACDGRPGVTSGPMSGESTTTALVVTAATPSSRASTAAVRARHAASSSTAPSSGTTATRSDAPNTTKNR